jgi:transcriptional regulator GlxA family with amidase domain
MDDHEKTIGFVLYPGFTGLDLIGPHEVLARCGWRCLFVAADLEPVTSDRQVRVLPDTTFATCPPLDILVVPGGPGQAAAMEDRVLIAFLAEQSVRVDWTVSVCTGALLLARAGVLRGRRATSHWLALGELRRLGAIPTPGRVVWDGPVVTGAGVSAGIDLALSLVAMLRGPEEAQRIQLAIEYDPQPPFDAGAPGKAPAGIVERLRQESRFAPQDDDPTQE